MNKKGFTPISMSDYIKKHLQSNQDMSKDEVKEALISAISSYHSGEKCECGNNLWVIGSAFAGNGCFNCITGEALPENDYELSEVMGSVF